MRTAEKIKVLTIIIAILGPIVGYGVTYRLIVSYNIVNPHEVIYNY